MPLHAALSRLGVIAAALLLVVSGTSAAGAAPRNPTDDPSDAARSPLAYGLGAEPTGPGSRGVTPGFRIDQDGLGIRDARGRVLIDLTPQEGADRTAFRRAAEALGFRVTDVNRDSGTLAGYIAESAVPKLAALPGVGTLARALAPVTAAGSVQSQGVQFQRVQAVLDAGIDGEGITIGALSDSYDTSASTVDGDPLTVRAADDVASGDLPGPGNPDNPQPVVVIEDAPAEQGGLDEGRAMLQILHDMAPKAKLCFATALGGEIGFANNIRRLADKAGPCGADVIVDDIIYFSEPFFSDGIIGDAVDDVAAQGVSYYSSAGNSGIEGGFEAPVRLVPAARSVPRTNLDFSAVDPALYDGGLQDARPGRGVDVAQTITLGQAGGLLDLQWDDPFDVDGATFGEPYFTAGGEITEPEGTESFAFTPTADQVGDTVQFRVDSIPTATTDLILGVTAPDGTELALVDTGSAPEAFAGDLEQAGEYTITISTFGGDTGDFTIDVRPVLTPSATTTDFNALFFTPDGEFLGAVADANRITGRPVEIAAISLDPEAFPDLRSLQVVISRSGTGPTPVTSIRAITNGDFYFTEYSDPLAVTTFGHPTAAGATGVAAYNAFKPNQPEPFTSAGGRLPISFDSAGNRYPEPQIRTSPLIASTDGVNTTFFVRDDVRDEDELPNFFGTSAAAPSAAGIAALVLDSRGGPGSVDPEAMRALLAGSTFDHDLDPAQSQGRARGLSVQASGAQGDERGIPVGALDDDDFFRLQYSGRGRIASITFLGATAAPTARGARGRSAGIVFDPRPLDADADSFEDSGFPFTVGETSGGLDADDVSAAFSGGRPSTAVRGQFRNLTVRFDGGLGSGQGLRFGIDRDLARSGFGDASQGNGADVLGGAVAIPDRRTLQDGLRFEAVRTDGSRFGGVIRNRLGAGYTPLDGFGLIDAERAVLGR